MPAYKVSASGQDAEAGAPSSGVLIALRKDLAACGTAEAVPFGDTRLLGRLAGMHVQLPGSQPLQLLGVYAHASGPEADRAHLFEAVAGMIEETTAAGGVCMAGGDWNAALLDLDRSTGESTATDRAYRDFVLAQGLCSLDRPRTPGAPRARSFFRDPTDPAAPASRIDDVLAVGGPSRSPLATVLPLGHCPTTDHVPLLYKIDASALGMVIPDPRPAAQTPAPARSKVLCVPIPAAAKETFRAAITDPCTPLSQHIDALHSHLSTAIESCIGPHLEQASSVNGREHHKLTQLPDPLGGPMRPAREQIEGMYSSLEGILLQCKQVALETCPTKLTNPGGKHFKPRKAANKRDALRRQYETLTALANEACAAGLDSPAELRDRVASRPTAAEMVAALDRLGPSELPLPTRLKGAQRAKRAEILALDRQNRKEGMA
jgi:hypothetical protein